MAELVDALDLGSSGVTRESSSLSFRTINFEVTMQVSIEVLQGLQRRLSVELPWEQVSEIESAKFNELSRSKKVKIDGFRPGKPIPLSVLKTRFGADIRSEALQEVTQKSFFEAVEQESIELAGYPHIEVKDNEEGKPYIYVATFEVYPTINLTDLNGQTINKTVASVTDADVDDTLSKLQKQHAEWETVERAAENGDQVTFDFLGKVDGVAFEGGEAKDFALELGSKQMIPGFEDALVGVKAGDETVIDVTFPEDYRVDDLAGKPSQFDIKVHKVAAAKLPELDDAFAEKFNVKEGGIAALREEIKTNMSNDLDSRLSAEYKDAVFEKMLELNDFEVPKSLVDQEIVNLQQQAKEQYKMRFGTESLPDQPAELFEESAKKRVALGLILSEVVKKHELKADADKVKELVEQRASMYEQSEEIVKWIYSNEEQLKQIEAMAIEEQVIDKLTESATITEQTKSYEEVAK